jgi:hypothetical protein
VELRDNTMLRAKDQKQLLKQSQANNISLSPEQVEAIKNGGAIQVDSSAMDAGLNAADRIMARMVTDWKLPYEPDPADDGTPREWVLPSVDVSIVDELSMPDYTKLTELVRPVLLAAFPGKPDPTDHKDPLSPTGPASG